jgi:transposase
MTMRIVALDLGARKTTYCEISQGQVVQRATASEVTSLDSLLGPGQAAATVAIEACREAWHVHDVLVEWGNEVVLINTTRSRQPGIGQHGRKTDRIDAETLARALEVGRIPAAHVLSRERREVRRVLAVRRTLVESRAEYITTVRGLVREQAGKIPSCDSEQFVRKARAQKLASAVGRLIEPQDYTKRFGRPGLHTYRPRLVLSNITPTTNPATARPSSSKATRRRSAARWSASRSERSRSSEARAADG